MTEVVGATVKINDIPVAVSADKTFNMSIPLNESSNTINIKASASGEEVIKDINILVTPV